MTRRPNAVLRALCEPYPTERAMDAMVPSSVRSCSAASSMRLAVRCSCGACPTAFSNRVGEHGAGHRTGPARFGDGGSASSGNS